MNPEQVQNIGTMGLAIYVLVEIFKRAGFPSRFAPVLSLVLGLGIGGISFLIMEKPWWEGVLTGFWASASASGIYSGTKSVFTPAPSSTALHTDDPALRPQC